MNTEPRPKNNETVENSAQSRRLIGANLEVETLNIRELRSTDSMQGSQAPVNQQLMEFLEPDVCRAVEQLNSHGFTSSYAGSRDILSIDIYEGMQRQLIDPKVKTGYIAELAIKAAQADELPPPMIKKFAAINQRERQKYEYIEGHDMYYQILGKFKTGSILSSIACGVCVSPYIDKYKDNETGEYFIRSFVRFRALIEKYKQGGITEEARAWDEIIQQSRLREGLAQNNPLRGGLINPR